MKVRFWPPFNLSYPKREQIVNAAVGHRGGTVDLESEDRTPYERVLLIDAGDEHPANGPFAQLIEEAEHESEETEGHTQVGEHDGQVDGAVETGTEETGQRREAEESGTTEHQ